MLKGSSLSYHLSIFEPSTQRFTSRAGNLWCGGSSDKRKPYYERCSIKMEASQVPVVLSSFYAELNLKSCPVPMSFHCSTTWVCDALAPELYSMLPRVLSEKDNRGLLFSAILTCRGLPNFLSTPSSQTMSSSASIFS